MSQPSFRIPLVAGLVLLAPSCGPRFHCGSDQATTVTSPDSSARAVVFRRNCGATTGFSTEVSVILLSEPLPTGDVVGNVFGVGDTSLYRGQDTGGDALSVKVEWVSPRLLQVTHNERAAILRQHQERHGVRIEYRTRP